MDAFWANAAQAIRVKTVMRICRPVCITFTFTVLQSYRIRVRWSLLSHKSKDNGLDSWR